MLIEAYNILQWIPSNWIGVVAVAEWFSMELPATRCEVINQASMQEEQQNRHARSKKGKQHQKMKSNIHWKFNSDTQQQDEEDSTEDQQDIVSVHMKG